MSVKSKLCGALLGAIVSMYSFNSYAQETIHVGTEPTFAPFGFVDDKTSEVVGFDIDVINAIGKAEGINVVIESMQFDGIIPSILSNSIDAAISGMTKNPEREKMVLFSDPYYVAGQDLMVRKDSDIDDDFKQFIEFECRRRLNRQFRANTQLFVITSNLFFG